MSRLTINFCHDEYLKCPPVARMQAWELGMSAPLINAIISKRSVPLQLTHQSVAASSHSHLALFLVVSLSQIL